LKIDRYRYLNQFGFVLRVLTHYYLTGLVGLIVYDNGLLNFVLLSEGVQNGYRIFSGRRKVKAFLGSTQKILNIRLFEPLNSIEKFPLSGAKIARSAGVFSNLFSKANEKSVLKLSSG